MTVRREQLREQLKAMATDAEYRRFSAALIPGEERLLGVRLPALRKLAKELCRSDWRELLTRPPKAPYMEEIMLDGMIVGLAKMEPEERLRLITEYVPRIDNWSLCDTFCAGLKFTRAHAAAVWELITPYLRAENPWAVRFAVVMMLDYYVTTLYIDEVLTLLDGVSREEYYVSMAVAWAFSICYVKFPERTMKALKKSALPDATYNRALQKIRESQRVSAPEKARLNSMKRRGRK